MNINQGEEKLEECGNLAVESATVGNNLSASKVLKLSRFKDWWSRRIPSKSACSAGFNSIPEQKQYVLPHNLYEVCLPLFLIVILSTQNLLFLVLIPVQVILFQNSIKVRLQKFIDRSKRLEKFKSSIVAQENEKIEKNKLQQELYKLQSELEQSRLNFENVKEITSQYEEDISRLSSDLMLEQKRSEVTQIDQTITQKVLEDCKQTLTERQFIIEKSQTDLQVSCTLVTDLQTQLQENISEVKSLSIDLQNSHQENEQLKMEHHQIQQQLEQTQTNLKSLQFKLEKEQSVRLQVEQELICLRQEKIRRRVIEILRNRCQ